MPKEKTEQSEQIASLTEQLNGLMAQVAALKEVPRHGLIRTKRETTHNCTLREYAEDGVVKGIVTRLYDWKEQKDPTEAKRFVGLCKLDILDPRTGKKETVKDVNGLGFLNDARSVQCLIVERNKSTREFVDPRPGVGVGLRRDTSGKIVPGSETVFTVIYTDEKFLLEVQDGEFTGMKVEIEVTNQGDSPINL